MMIKSLLGIVLSIAMVIVVHFQTKNMYILLLHTIAALLFASYCSYRLGRTVEEAIPEVLYEEEEKIESN